jgi:predicted RNase H-like HicB family nuclease
MGEGLTVAHYIALIHKDSDSSYGVSFPDIPGVIASADSIDEAMSEAGEALAFAAEDWSKLTGGPFPRPRTIDELREDPAFRDDAIEAVVAAIPFRAKVDAAA